MNKFDTRSMSFLGGIIGICFIFVMVVWNAFDYLPQESSEDPIQSLIKEEQLRQENSQKNVSTENNKDNSAEEEISDEDIDEPVTVVSKPTSQTVNQLEVIPDEELTEGKNIATTLEVSESPQEKLLASARNLKSEKQYTAAIAEYEKLIQTTNDTKLKAICYEEMATIYGIVKRYGSALSAAQRAYNLSPNSAREVLLARLYYKTGELNKATERVNNVLKRDFGVND